MNLRRTPFFAVPIALALALSATGVRCAAQSQPATPVAQPATPVAQPAAPQIQPAAAPAAKAAEPAAAQASAEPQGEPAEAEGGHAHHPVIKLFGHSLGVMGQFGVSVFNFVLFAVILFVLLKGALASAFQARTRELTDKLSLAERDKAEAEAQIRELEGRMAGLQQELEGIMAKAEAEAEAEKTRILESAQTEAAQIRAQTGAEILAQQRSAESGLRALVAELVVAGAAQRLEAQVTGEAAARAMDQAIAQVGGKS
jgi:F-type H+-transporting ATPase subunit b